MSTWEKEALKLLRKSLNPIAQELNELDWKAALSPNKERIGEHLSAFSNHQGGGFLVYGINSSGAPEGLPNMLFIFRFGRDI